MAGKSDAKIFRRGNKQELFEFDCKQVTDYKEENHKLNDLHELWKEPRSGKDLAAAIWREQYNLAEVVLHKGKLLNHMGFLLRGRLHLYIEEAVFLVDRASMLLFTVDKRGKKQLLSLQEAVALMINVGVSMELFSIYSKLIRAGYIVCRYKENVQKRTFKESEDIILKDQFGLKAPKHDTRKARVLWWPVAYEIETLPSCEVESLEGSMEESHHWTVKAKPFSSFQEIPADNDSSHADHMPLVVTQVFEVYKGKDSFSRKEPGRPLFRVVHDKGPLIPSIQKQLDIAEAFGDIPVRYVPIEKGDVAFYAVAETELTSILR